MVKNIDLKGLKRKSLLRGTFKITFFVKTILEKIGGRYYSYFYQEKYLVLHISNHGLAHERIIYHLYNLKMDICRVVSSKRWIKQNTVSYYKRYDYTH